MSLGYQASSISVSIHIAVKCMCFILSKKMSCSNVTDKISAFYALKLSIQPAFILT